MSEECEKHHVVVTVLPGAAPGGLDALIMQVCGMDEWTALALLDEARDQLLQALRAQAAERN